MFRSAINVHQTPSTINGLKNFSYFSQVQKYTGRYEGAAYLFTLGPNFYHGCSFR